MEPLQAMEEAYATIRQSKRRRGFVYSVNDCFCLFRTYDRLLRGEDLDWLEFPYHSKTGFFRRLRNRGIVTLEDLVERANYSQVGQPLLGDVAAMTDTEGGPTTVIYHGDYWLNSSPGFNHDRLPHRLVMKNVLLIARPNKESSNERT